MLDKNKQYRTKNNEPIRIYATDGGPGKCEIHGAIQSNRTGAWQSAIWGNETAFFDLGNREYNPLDELEEGTPLLVWNDISSYKLIRIYAGTRNYKGNPLVYIDGRFNGPLATYDHFEVLK